jgi:hypothetical protein
MRRDVEHARIALEDGLRAISMVDVDVDDRYALQTAVERSCRCDRGVAKQAEAHGAVALGVMTGRPHQGDRRLASCKRMFHGLHGRAGGQQANRVRIGRREGIGVDHRRAARGGSDRFQILPVVDPRQFDSRGRAWNNRGRSGSNPAGRKGIEHMGALDPLWVAGRRHVFCKLG